jgi:colanic acid biosynthesis glycosyl transferase WcaI
MEEIPNWVDVGFFATPAAPAEPSFRTRLGLEPDDVLVLYSGNMGRSHPLTLVVQAAARLRERENLKFALIGAGAGLAPAKAEAEAAHLSSIRFLPFQPRAALPDVLAGAGIAVVTQLSGMGAFSLPSRMYMFMAAGLPIIGSFDADSGAAELLASAQCGIQVNPNEPDWLAAAIARLADDLGLRRRLGEAGREYVLRCCDRRMAGTSYERVLLAAREREA